MRKLIVFGLVVLTVLSAVQAQELTETFSSGNGAVSFEYPAGWFATEFNVDQYDLSGVVVTNDGAYLEQYLSNPLMSAPSDETIYLQIFTVAEYSAYTSNLVEISFSSAEEAIPALAELMVVPGAESEIYSIEAGGRAFDVLQVRLQDAELGFDLTSTVYAAGNTIAFSGSTSGTAEQASAVAESILSTLSSPGESTSVSAPILMPDLVEPQCDSEGRYVDLEGEANPTLCGYDGNTLAEAIGLQSEEPFVGTLSSVQSAYSILMAGGAPEETTGFASVLLAGPAEYTISVSPETMQMIAFSSQEDMRMPTVTFFPQDAYFDSEVLFPGDMLTPDGNWFPADLLFPGDMLFPEETSPQNYTFFPGDMLHPVTDYVPGTEMFPGDMLFSGDMLEPETNYYGTVVLPVESGRDESAQLPVVFGIAQPESAEQVAEILLSTSPEQIRVYEMDFETGEQRLLETGFDQRGGIQLSAEVNTLYALYVFESATAAEEAPEFMRYPPPQMPE